MEFIVGCIVIYFLIQMFAGNNNVSTSNRQYQVNCSCPYCGENYFLENDYYNCSNCGKNFRKTSNGTYRDEVTVNDLVELLVQLLAYISKADGVVTENEVEYLKNLLKNDLNLNFEQRKWCGDVFNKYKKLTYDKSVVFSLNKNINGDSDIKLFILYNIMSMSNLDSGITKDQQFIINDLVSILNIPVSDYDELKGQFDSYGHQNNNYNDRKSDNNLDNYYTVLGLKPDATSDEVKKAYRKLMKIYHPDNHESKGLPDEILKDITEKTMKIQEAYEQIKKNSGF